MGVDPEAENGENTGRKSGPEGSEAPDRANSSEAKEEWLKLARITGTLTVAGFQMGILLAIGTFLGNWLDKQIGRVGPFTIVGAVAGFGIGLWLVVRTLKRI